MAIRTLRRRVIIREYDYKKVCGQAFALIGIHDSLYDRAEFTPLNREALEKLKIVEILKGKTSPLSEMEFDKPIPAILLYNLKDFLYDKRYVDWSVTEDEDGYLCVQSRKNTPKTRLGMAVFEKDLKSRL